MSLLDPFAFQRPKYSKKSEALREAGGFRLFNSNWIGPKWSAGEVAPDDIDEAQAYRYVNTPYTNIPDRIAKIHDFYYYLAQSPEDLRRADQYVIETVDKLYPSMTVVEKAQASVMKKAFQVKLLLDTGYKDVKYSKLDERTKQVLEEYIATENIRHDVEMERLNVPDVVKDLLPADVRAGVEGISEALQPFKRFLKGLLPSLQEVEDQAMYARLSERTDTLDVRKAPRTSATVEDDSAELQRRIATLNYLLSLERMRQEKEDNIDTMTRVNFLEL